MTLDWLLVLFWSFFLKFFLNSLFLKSKDYDKFVGQGSHLILTLKYFLFNLSKCFEKITHNFSLTLASTLKNSLH